MCSCNVLYYNRYLSIRLLCLGNCFSFYTMYTMRNTFALSGSLEFFKMIPDSVCLEPSTRSITILFPNGLIFIMSSKINGAVCMIRTYCSSWTPKLFYNDRIKWSGVRESNSRPKIGNLLFYH